MESNKSERQSLLVMPLGFDAAVIERLNTIFQQPRDSERRYDLTKSSSPQSEASILLVNYDNPVALSEKDRLVNTSYAHAFVVAVSQGPLVNAPLYHIRGMLTAARVLTLLDKIPVVLSKPVPVVEEPAPVQEVTPSIVKPKVPVTGGRKGYSALVVDDSVAIQKALELKLTTLEQITHIDFADSGESALEKAESTQYDLIFLDVMMPGIDGYETCTRLRKKPEYKKTPIIMVSGKSSPLDEVKGVIAGCTTYLIKPVQDEAFQKLGVRVLTWLGERSSA